MKKLSHLIILIFIIIFSLPSCKKGENDPFLSLRSRKARITGEWVLKSGNVTYTENDTNDVTTYDGTNAVSSIYGSFPLTQKWKINKNGTYERIVHNNGNVFTTKGIWTFGDKIKDADIKNKETVTFIIEYYNVIYYGGTGNYTETYSGSSSPNYTMNIDKLKNKEMVLLFEGTETWPDNSKSQTGSMTFTQEKK